MKIHGETILNNLPLPLSSFIGRERELAEVKQLLGIARLVTLTGAGGCGKTTLALRVARDLLDTYPNGVWWIEFASLTDSALLPQAITNVLGIVEQPNRTPIDILNDYLREKELLLVLDNCEHLIEACARLVETLLQRCPDLYILATSREALNIAGEFAWIVPSLELPTSDLLPVSNLQHYDSIRLFVERVVSVAPNFKLTNQNANAVTQICQRLDGIPLAIELASARVKHLSVEQIAARLDDAMRLLTEGKRGAAPRHQTLRAMMDWSYGLLSQPEQSMFRRLSVFAGGFTLEAAEMICASENLEGGQVLNVLAHLVDKSLVVKREQDGNVRYRMLEPIRQYALQRLDESRETVQIRNRHLQYFLKLAEMAEPKLTSVDRDIWLARLEADYDNLRAAHEFSQTIDDPEIELRLAGALTWFWYFGNYQDEGRRWLERALTRAEGLMTEPATRAIALLGAGRLARAIGPLRLARARLMESVRLFKELGDRMRTAYALSALGIITLSDGDYIEARVLCEESVEIARELGDKWLLAFALSDLGNTLGDADHPRARQILEEALTYAREKSARVLIARNLSNLSERDMREGDFSTAHKRREEMLALFNELGSKQGVALALLSLADVARAQGDYEGAEILYEKSQVLFSEVGLSLAGPLYNLAAVAQHRGETTRALALFKESLIQRRQDGERQGMAEALEGLAGVAAEAGHPLRAARLFGAAEAIRDVFHLPIRQYNRAPYDRYLPPARSQVDEKTFTAAWEEGRAMTIEQAIAEAEQITVPPHVASAAKPDDPNALTARELEVLRLLAQGLGDAQIAEKLVISRRTVNAHLTAIYGKLDVNSRTAATRYALDHHLV